MKADLRKKRKADLHTSGRRVLNSVRNHRSGRGGSAPHTADGESFPFPARFPGVRIGPGGRLLIDAPGEASLHKVASHDASEIFRVRGGFMFRVPCAIAGSAVDRMGVFAEHTPKDSTDLA